MKKFFSKKRNVIIAVVIAVMLIILTTFGVLFLSKNCMVKFDSNGAGKIKSIWVSKGEKLDEKSLPNPVKEGHTFLGWYVDKEQNTQYINSEINENTTLYASFVETQDIVINEIEEATIGEVDTDFEITLVSSKKLSTKNINEYVNLIVHYGNSDDEIKLSVKDKGNNKYLVKANYAKPGRYTIELISNDVKFDIEDEIIKNFGLTEMLKKLSFSTVDKNYENIKYNSAVKETSDKEIIAFTNNVLVVDKSSNINVGNIVSLPYMESVDYFKLTSEITLNDALNRGVKVDNTSDVKFFLVELAPLDEVFNEMEVYSYKEFSEEDYSISEEKLKEEIENAMLNNEELNEFTEMLLLGAEYTETYQDMSMDTYGEVVKLKPIEVTLPSGVTVDVDLNATNPYYTKWMNTDSSFEFIKLHIEVERSVPIKKLAGGNLEVSAKVSLDFWFHAHLAGWTVLELGYVDMDAYIATATHTEFSFELAVSTQDGVKQKVITDEFKEIMNGVSNPSVESFLESYNNIMSGPDSSPIELFRYTIVEPKTLVGIINVSMPVELVITVDFRASFSSNMVVMTGDCFGIRGSTKTSIEPYHLKVPTRYKFSMQLKGNVDVRVGTEISAKFSFAGLGRLGNIALSVQAGPYMELYGFYYLDIDMIDIYNSPWPSAGGSYFMELGAFLNINISATVLKTKYKADLYDKEWPIYTLGEEEVFYNFSDVTGDEIMMDTTSYNLRDNPDILDVLLYNITEEKSDFNPREIDSSVMMNDLNNKQLFTIKFDNYRFRYNEQNQTIEYIGGLENDEATMTIHYYGTRMSFNDSISKRVKVKYWNEETLGEYDPSKIGTKYTITYMLDDVVCKKEEIEYGSRVTNSGVWDYDIPEELKEKGYLAVKWDHENPVVVSDMTFEGIGNRPSSKYHFHYVDENGEEQVTTIDVEYGTIPDVSEFEKTIASLKFTGWDKEIIEANWRIPRVVDGFDYYAQYEVNNSAVINFNVGDGVLVDINDNILNGTKITAYWDKNMIYQIRNTASHTGADYNFVGWEYNGKTYKLYDGIPLESGNEITLKAIYEKKPIEITLLDPTETRNVYANMNEVIILPDYNLDDKVLLGWRSEIDGELYTSYYAVKGNETLTPEFMEKDKAHKVIFDLDGGILPDGTTRVEMNIPDGETIPEVGVPVLNNNDGKVYRFSHFSPSLDTPVTEDIIVKAIYEEIFVGEGLRISNGTTSELISTYYDGNNKVAGYSVEDVNGIPKLTIKKSGLILSGVGYALIDIPTGVELTMKDLTLNLTDNYPFIVNGNTTINIEGHVTINQKDYSDAIRGESGKLTLKGIDGGKLSINASEFGIRTMGTLLINDLVLDITTKGSDGYLSTALSAGFSALNLQPINIKNSDITINEGVIDTGFKMNNSVIHFGNGNNTGIDSYYYDEEITDTLEEKPVVTLNNSILDFNGDIRFGITLYHAKTDTTFEISKGEDANYNPILKGYASQTEYINALGKYKWLVSIDSSSKIK